MDDRANLAHLLQRGSAADKPQIKVLLTRHHDHLLRTLECEPSTDQPGIGSIKRPAFPALTGNAVPGDKARKAACTLLQVDDKAAGELIAGFKRDAYNCVQALEIEADVADLHAPLAAEIALLRYAHEQRCLLLRCVHLLLTTAFNSGAELHIQACASVSLLLQGGLPARVVALVPTLRAPTSTELHMRLPARLQSETCSSVERERHVWLNEVGALLAVHAAKERCEALGLLLLLRYMPVHHTALPESLDPLSGMLTAQSANPPNNDGAPSALYEVVVGKQTTLKPLLDALVPLLNSGAAQTTTILAASPPTSSVEEAIEARQAWDTRAEQLSTLTLMAAMHGEKDFCQLVPPMIARTPAVKERFTAVTSELVWHGHVAMSALGTSSSSAFGALLITWCVVILEVAPDEQVAELASQLAVMGEALHGLRWGVELLRTRGFRHDDPPEELSSIARNLHFDLVAGMLSQQRFRQYIAPEPNAAHGGVASEETLMDIASDSTTHAADTGWPAHSEGLVTLMAAVLEARPALCRTFWANAGSVADGSLGSLLLNARFPQRMQPLTSLLAALCADGESAAQAWTFAHQLPRVCHHLPRQCETYGLSVHAPNELRIEVRIV